MKKEKRTIKKAEPNKGKPRVGIFSFTSCSGCQVQLLNSIGLLELLPHIDIVEFKMISDREMHKPLDVAFIEGAITTQEEVERIKEIRKMAGVVVAIGACASFGGIPSIKNFIEEDVKKTVYGEMDNVNTLKKAKGVGEYVPVDYYLRGCPIDHEEFEAVVKDVLWGKKPLQKQLAVCYECKKNENVCMFEKGRVCMGPITQGGCNSVCINNGKVCYGCRGPMEQANIDSIIELFKEYNLEKKQIRDLFRKFAGYSRKLREVEI